MGVSWITVYVLVHLGIVPPEIQPGHYDRASCVTLQRAMGEEASGRYECIPVKIPAVILNKP